MGLRQPPFSRPISDIIIIQINMALRKLLHCGLASPYSVRTRGQRQVALESNDCRRSAACQWEPIGRAQQGPPGSAAAPAVAPTAMWPLHASSRGRSRRAETAAASRCESPPPPGAVLKPSWARTQRRTRLVWVGGLPWGGCASAAAILALLSFPIQNSSLLRFGFGFDSTRDWIHQRGNFLSWPVFCFPSCCIVSLDTFGRLPWSLSFSSLSLSLCAFSSVPIAPLVIGQAFLSLRHPQDRLYSPNLHTTFILRRRSFSRNQEANEFGHKTQAVTIQFNNDSHCTSVRDRSNRHESLDRGQPSAVLRAPASSLRALGCSIISNRRRRRQ